MMKQFDHMIERKLNPRLKFLAGCGQFSDFSNMFFQKVFHFGYRALLSWLRRHALILTQKRGSIAKVASEPKTHNWCHAMYS